MYSHCYSLVNGIKFPFWKETAMTEIMELIRKLRNPDNKRVLQAVEELRVRGWLQDGSLLNIPLCYVHMQGADLFEADLRKVDLHQAHLEWADLSKANLEGSKLTRANLQGANFDSANLDGADLFKANLIEARNLTDEQLSKCRRLFGATMPNGDPYDGRYQLNGDIEFARWGRVDVDDPQAMADFFGVTLDRYLSGVEDIQLA